MRVLIRLVISSGSSKNLSHADFVVTVTCAGAAVVAFGTVAAEESDSFGPCVLHGLLDFDDLVFF